MANQFLSDARNQFHGSSPLYYRLSTGVAEDLGILSLAAGARRDEPSVPLLFLGAVHFLLLKDSKDPLSRFYPSITRRCLETEENPYPLFRAFCLEHQTEIRRIVSTRRVQTNEVRRCACLVPAFSLASRKAHGHALALIEVGASAGLNLLWDKYGYDYGNGMTCGDPVSPVQISCGLRGDIVLPTLSELPAIGSRIGIDLDPVDLEDEDHVLWLRALVWPEHLKRADLLWKAIEFARRHPPRIVKGDVLDLLPGVLDEQSDDYEICVFSSNTLFRFPEEKLREFSSLLANFSQKRDVFQVCYEWWRGSTWQQLELSSFSSGTVRKEFLGFGHPHGEWLRWAAPANHRKESP